MIHGSRRLSGLFFRDYFASTFAESYEPCCSLEEGEGVFHGRLTAYLSDRPSRADCRYLLCGSAEMVVEVRDLLIGGGVPFSNIGAEIYF